MAQEVAPGGPVGSMAPAVGPRWPWMVTFALFGAPWCAYDWATAASPEKSLATYFWDQASGIGFFLVGCVLASALANWRKTLQGLLFPLTIAPFYLVGLVPRVAAVTVGWGEGWVLGIAGAAAGTAAGVTMGWMFTRWILPDTQIPKPVVRGFRLPIGFAVLFALFGAYSWATAWLATLGEAWALGLFPIVFAFLGALVGRPLLGMLSALPLVVVLLVPLVASLTMGWEGGWRLGVAGAVAGALAGAVAGWLYDRWIMPEYAKRRERELALRSPGSTAGPGSSRAMV